MLNSPTKQRLKSLPPVYSTEDISVEKKIIHMHFCFGDCNWYVAEFDGEDTFFGYVILHGDTQNAEWGYFSLSELESIRIAGKYEVIHNTSWKPKEACSIPDICV